MAIRHVIPNTVYEARTDYTTQVDELKGANASELRSQVDLLLYQAFPRSLIFFQVGIPTLTSFDSPSSFETLPTRRRGVVPQSHIVYTSSSP